MLYCYTVGTKLLPTRASTSPEHVPLQFGAHLRLRTHGLVVRHSVPIATLGRAIITGFLPGLCNSGSNVAYKHQVMIVIWRLSKDHEIITILYEYDML